MSEDKADVFGVNEEQAFAAIFEDKPMVIKFPVGTGDNERILEVAVMWPDGDDEGQIIARSAEILDVRPDFTTNFDIAWARGRAVLEQLACDPLPAWLIGPNGKYLGHQPLSWRGRTVVRPDTGKLKNKAIPAAFWYAYNEVIGRFHTLTY